MNSTMYDDGLVELIWENDEIVNMRRPSPSTKNCKSNVGTAAEDYGGDSSWPFKFNHIINNNHVKKIKTKQFHNDNKVHLLSRRCRPLLRLRQEYHEPAHIDLSNYKNVKIDQRISTPWPTKTKLCADLFSSSSSSSSSSSVVPPHIKRVAAPSNSPNNSINSRNKRMINSESSMPIGHEDIAKKKIKKEDIHMKNNISSTSTPISLRSKLQQDDHHADYYSSSQPLVLLKTGNKENTKLQNYHSAYCNDDELVVPSFSVGASNDDDLPPAFNNIDPPSPHYISGQRCAYAYPSQGVEEEPQALSAQEVVPEPRPTAPNRNSRTTEVHNLSERRRRDKINKKMRALQALIPNCNKVDKASILDEAIAYLTTLQLQIQIMSMGLSRGLNLMTPMSVMLSNGVVGCFSGHVATSRLGVGPTAVPTPRFQMFGFPLSVLASQSQPNPFIIPNLHVSPSPCTHQQLKQTTGSSL